MCVDLSRVSQVEDHHSRLLHTACSSTLTISRVGSQGMYDTSRTFWRAPCVPVFGRMRLSHESTRPRKARLQRHNRSQLLSVIDTHFTWRSLYDEYVNTYRQHIASSETIKSTRYHRVVSTTRLFGGATAAASSYCSCNTDKKYTQLFFRRSRYHIKRHSSIAHGWLATRAHYLNRPPQTT